MSGPKINGRCPMGCGETLFVGDGGHITCGYAQCPNPSAASDTLACGQLLDRYPEENSENDDGTMRGNVDELRQAVVGHRIVNAERGQVPHPWYADKQTDGFAITLDNGTQVTLTNTNDCCAYTDLEAFLLHADKIDHVIIGVGTTGKFETWHIYADWGDVLELTVGWSGGNLGYYGFGFDINVVPA